MLSFKAGNISFNVPSSYYEMTVGQYLLFDGENSAVDVLCQITGIEPESLICIDLLPVIEALGYIKQHPTEEIESTNEIIVNDHLIQLDNLGRYQWGQKLIAVSRLSDHDHIGMLATYLQPFVKGRKKKFNADKIDNVRELLLDKTVAEVYGCARYVQEQLIQILEDEASIPRPDITPEQERAGIKMFGSLGDFNTIDELAHGQPWRYEEVLAMDYDTIYNKLKKNNISAIFERRYAEIMTPKPQNKKS